jgi:hypothetical protein
MKVNYDVRMPLSLESVKAWRFWHSEDLTARTKRHRKEVRFAQKDTLRTLDLFAGVGALSMGLEETGGFRTTHAVEIGPSTAQTLRYA